MFNTPLKEKSFADFILSVVDSIQDEQLKKRAQLKIKSLIYKYFDEDVAKQMIKDIQDD